MLYDDRCSTTNGELACKMWEYLVKQEDIREMFIHNLFSDKVVSLCQIITVKVSCCYRTVVVFKMLVVLSCTRMLMVKLPLSV